MPILAEFVISEILAWIFPDPSTYCHFLWQNDRSRRSPKHFWHFEK